jgi:hypothetical protein
MGCSGTFAGTKFQAVDSKGKKIGQTITSDDTYVAGDMVTMSDGRICWPYVNMAWSLDGPTQAADVNKISFACMTNGSGSGSSSSASKAFTTVAQPSATKTANVGAAKPSAAESTVAAVKPTTARPTEESASSAAAVEPSSVVIKPSVPAIPKADEIEAPLEATPTYPEPADGEGEGEDCNKNEFGNAATQASNPTSRTTRIRRPHPTSFSWGNNSGKKCVAKTVTHTVYITASPTALDY